MAKYRKVDPRIWNDEKFRALSDSGKLVFLFVLTHPHMTSLGAMRASVPGMAAELVWKVKAFREAFGEGCSVGLVQYDEKASFVGVPNFLKYNGPESPNVIRSWGDAWDRLPECELKDQLPQKLKGFAEGLTEGFQKAWLDIEKAFPKPFQSLSKAFPKALGKVPYARDREQEQEQEQEQETPPKSPRGDSLDSVMYPAGMDTPEVRRAITTWLTHKKKRGESYKDPADQIGLLLASPRFNRDPATFVAAVNHSKGNNWAGCFPPKESDRGKKATDPGSIYTPGATGEGIGDI